jgi:hypothetical protein
MYRFITLLVRLYLEGYVHQVDLQPNSVAASDLGNWAAYLNTVPPTSASLFYHFWILS